MSNFLLLSVLLAISFSDAASHGKTVMCYYGSWATYRQGLGNFNVEDIDPYICTHIVYTFVGLNNDGTIRHLNPELDIQKNNFGRLAALKNQNPDLKLLLSIGGFNEGSAKYSRMAASAQLRNIFIKSALDIVLKFGFDGFDVDWEYPNKRDTVYGHQDVDNFTKLLKELREEFKPYGLILTAAVGASADTAATSYDIKSFSEHVDFVNLMAYDFTGSWSPVTGHNAGLYNSANINNGHNVDAVVTYWLDQGCPPEKLILGLPLYERTLTLADPKNTNVGARASGAGISGPYTLERGFLGYNELCEMFLKQSWDVRYDESAKVFYAIQNSNYISFDNDKSLTYKTEYAMERGLGGVLFWSIETDDFRGVCHEENFHLIRTVNRVLGRSGETVVPPPDTDSSEGVPPPTPPPTTSTTSTTTTTSSTTTPSPPTSTDICADEGLTSNPDDCGSFYFCVRGTNGNLVPNKLQCPNGLVWDQSNQYCNYPELANCSS